MLTTHFADGLRARPVEPRPDRDAGLIWIITDLRSAKEHEIEAEHDIGLTFIDESENAYLSLTARAGVRRDHAKAAEIWKMTDTMWWHGPDDPQRLRAARCAADRRIVGWAGEQGGRRIRVPQVAADRRKPNLGENRKITVSM